MMTSSPASAPFHTMAKPAGAMCNLDCTYCFYLERETAGTRMDDATLRRHVEQVIAGTPPDAEEIPFAWQGGEPTLMGLDFFRRAVALQKELCPPGRKITNALQTNGILVDDAWCAFFKAEGFLIGLSLDGPPHIHDARRVDKGGRPTFPRVMAALERLKKHGVEFNTLTVVGSHNQDHPLQVYRFLRKHGSGFIQFIPAIERVAGPDKQQFTGPPELAPDAPLSPLSVDGEKFGRFLAQVFDEWAQSDVGTVFVRDFDTWLGLWMGLPSSLCVYAETCGRAVVVEHDGGVYACDHYVYPEYRVGDLATSSLTEIVDGPRMRFFGDSKRDRLPAACRRCEWLKVCNGGCPKHRFRPVEGGPVDHLCPGLKHFFAHVDTRMRAMAGLVAKGRPAAEIMQRRWLPQDR